MVKILSSHPRHITSPQWGERKKRLTSTVEEPQAGRRETFDSLPGAQKAKTFDSLPRAQENPGVDYHL